MSPACNFSICTSLSMEASKLKRCVSSLASDSSVPTFFMICAIVVFVPLMRTSAAWNSAEHTSAVAAAESAGSWTRVTPASDGS